MSSPTLRLPPPALKARWLGEPLLGFAHGVAHPDPKVGIPYAGPRSLGTPRHREAVHIGLIGTAQGVEATRGYLESAAGGVDGDETHHPFPGFRPDRGFRTDLRIDDARVAVITAAERRSVLDSTKGQRVRFEELLGILEDRVRYLANIEAPVDLVLVVLPYDVAKRCATANYVEDGRLAHRDLHSALKARCMRYRMPTQLIWETSAGLVDGHSADQHQADVAWSLFTAIYFKADGSPWSPIGLSDGTCFVGIDFYQPPQSPASARASFAQVFAETGDAFVLPGAPVRGDWTGRSPHLRAEESASLIANVREAYAQTFGLQPQHVVVHKRTPFGDAERQGFEEALSDIEFDLATVRPSDHMRLVRNGEYPPHRGTLYSFGEDSYLYTTGALAVAGLYPNEHVSGPLNISHHTGHSSYDRLLQDILLLTKMNWNSGRYAEQMPMTLELADRVGNVLKESGPDSDLESKYAFYV